MNNRYLEIYGNEQSAKVFTTLLRMGNMFVIRPEPLKSYTELFVANKPLPEKEPVQKIIEQNVGGLDLSRFESDVCLNDIDIQEFIKLLEKRDTMFSSPYFQSIKSFANRFGDKVIKTLYFVSNFVPFIR